MQCEKPTLTIDEGKVLIRDRPQAQQGFPNQHRGSLGAGVSSHGRTGAQRADRQAPADRSDPAQTAQLSRRSDPAAGARRTSTTTCGSGPAPYAPYTKDRVHFNFRWIWDYSGGIICDWGAHLFDTAQWANDTERSGPVEIEGTGTHWEGGLYNTVKDYDVTYRYANGVVMTCKPGNPSIKFIGTEGWVGNTGWRGPVQASSPEILNSKIGPEELHLYTNPEGEHDDFLKCVKSRKDPYFPVEIGHRVSTVCHLANIAIKLGRKLKWDPAAERFVNDSQANQMLSRPMRAPWKLSLASAVPARP